MASETPQADPEVESPDVHFEPIVQLPLIEVANYEEGEEELIQLRAKLFRFDKTRDPPEWKERGTGTVKLLKNQETELIRVVMRRDKTYKTCANHYIQPEMELKPNCGSDKAWVWTTPSDYADGEAKSEMLAIRFANAENAQKFKSKFEEAQKMMKDIIPKHNSNVQRNGVADSKEDSKEDNDTKESPSGSGDNKTDSEKLDAKDVTDKLESLTVKDSEKNTTDTEKESDKSTTEEKKD